MGFFVSNYSHQAIARQYEERIAELKSHIVRLEKLVFSPTSASNIPLVALEADAVLSQKEEVINLSQEEIAKAQEIEAEASRLLSGNY